MSVLQKGMGYGMYLLVLPFFAWMIVLVVSLMKFFVLVLFGFLPVCTCVCCFAMHSCNGKQLIPLQAVYADAYVATVGNLGPAKSGIGVNELNQCNLLTSLASQRLVLYQTAAGKAEQRVQ